MAQTLSFVKDAVAKKINACKEQWNECMLGPFELSRIKFKRCIQDTIVVLYLPNHVQTNENRKTIDKRFAKYRATKAWCLFIYHIHGNSFFDDLAHHVDLGLCIKEILYKVNEWVVPDAYHSDPDVICGGGIHFFNHVEPAFFYNQWWTKSPNFGTHYLGKEKNAIYWNEDGQVQYFFVKGEVTCHLQSSFLGLDHLQYIDHKTSLYP
jgi:hypothetical protein